MWSIIASAAGYLVCFVDMAGILVLYYNLILFMKVIVNMSRKNIYFVQVGFAFDSSLYLPYAVGTLAAYAFADDGIKNEYSLCELIFKREKLDSIVSRLDEPYLVAFSCYIWNFEFNKALAQKIKAAYPDCHIVFGGHSISETDLPLNTDYIDIFMFGEGEESFAALLKALPNGDLSTVPNIAYRRGGELTHTERNQFPSLDNYPSPYIAGVFDDIMAKNPDVDFLGILETNRGCPYSCSYCDWCSGRKLRLFPLKKVESEIEWLSEHKIEYCFCADSNFGMLERDTVIVDKLLQAKAKNGYPKVFRPCYDKNSDERVFEISRKLNAGGMDKGATMAYQTLSDQALKNVNRQNLTLEHFSDLMKLYGENHIPAYSELILGLPGETYESFREGICRLLELGQHNSISVYYCEMLPNSPMAQKEYIERYGIISETVGFNHIHSSAHTEEVPEFSKIIVATNTMSREDWVRANMFSVCVQCFHNLGLLRLFAIYLYSEKNVSYLDFYTALLERIMSDSGTLMNGLFASFQSKLSRSDREWNYRSEILGEAAWFFEEGAFIEALMNYEQFWAEMLPFLKSFGIDEGIFRSLLDYQRKIIRQPGVNEFTIEQDYNFYAYFEHIYSGVYSPLEKSRSTLHFKYDDNISDIRTYARELVWYGRRKGATIAKPIK